MKISVSGVLIFGIVTPLFIYAIASHVLPENLAIALAILVSGLTYGVYEINRKLPEIRAALGLRVIRRR